MKSSAYGEPIIEKNGRIQRLARAQAFNEVYIQELIFKNPDLLPINEIDESFSPALPVCKELNTPSGLLDIFMITPTGRIVIVETKLWKNPEARRKVIAQILDYAREISKWAYEDLLREVNKNLKLKGNTLYKIACRVEDEFTISESSFVDSVSKNLKKGNFLLLIVGDGIREGAANITEFLASSAHLNFTFGMVELAIYEDDDIGKIILPRINVKTVELKRIILELQEGIKYSEGYTNESNNEALDEGKLKEKKFYQQFWKEFVDELELDDQGQAMPEPSNSTNLFIYLPSRHIWVSAYFMKSAKRVGVYVRCSNSKIGNEIAEYLDERKDDFIERLDDDITWQSFSTGRGPYIRMSFNDVFLEENRTKIKDFFKYYINHFVNIFRPLLKELDYK